MLLVLMALVCCACPWDFLDSLSQAALYTRARTRPLGFAQPVVVLIGWAIDDIISRVQHKCCTPLGWPLGASIY